MALQETRTPVSTQYIIEGYLFILYGSGGRREYAGVGFVVDLRCRRAITFTHSDTSRIALLGLSTGPRQLIIGSVYAPQGTRPVEERKAFYEVLEGITAKFQTKGALFLMGDYNARFSEPTVPGIMGPWHFRSVEPTATGEGETNAELLQEFCHTFSMLSPGSWQEKTEDKMVTYRAPGVNHLPGQRPDPAKFAELDLVL
eukprot:12310259-Alexandrium_andersonii.AAC.1